MKHFITISILFLLIITHINAQTDFRSGYIIGNDNDTINGLIDYKANKTNAKKCIFKKDTDSEKQIFTPAQIKGYVFPNGKYYVSRSVTDADGTKLLFLEYLINGIVDVYFYRGGAQDHYLVDVDGELRDLKTIEKEVKKGGNTYIKKKKEYVGVLKFLFSESPSIMKRAEKVRLNHKSLVKIAHDYHDEVCADQECIVYEKQELDSKRSLGLVVGINGLSFTQTSRYEYELYHMNPDQFDFTLSPSVGIYYKESMPRVDANMHFQYELTYSRMQITGTSTYLDPLYNSTWISELDIVQHAINNLAYIRYDYPKGKIRPTFHAGAFLSMFVKTDYSRHMFLKSPSGNKYDKGYDNTNHLNRLDYGINLGAGIKFNYLRTKELHIDLRYLLGFGWIERANSHAIMLNCGFQVW